MASPRDAVSLASRTVVAVFDSFPAAEAAARDLYALGLNEENVSVVARPPGTPAEIPADDTKTNEGILAGAGVGAVLGGVAGLAALAIPGIGPIVAAGPILNALAGAVGGATMGGFLGSFAGLEMPKERAEAYEAAVRAGGVFVAAQTPDADAAARVRDVLTRHGARDVEDYASAL